MAGPVHQRVLAVALAALSLGGCNEAYNAAQRELAAMHAAGRYDAAAAFLDDPVHREKFAEKSQLLVWLDRGAIALAQRNPELSTDQLEKAEAFMETRRDPSAGDEISKWLINDTAATYYGEPYEEIYANVLKIAARLERNEIEGGATVEARRMAGKADVLRDRYLRTLGAVSERGAKEVRGFSTPALTGSRESSGGEFIESPLGLFLSAVTFMKSGDRDLQGVVARRLTTAINSQGDLIGPVRAADFEGLGERRPEEVNACFVAFSGRGPTKYARSFGPIPIYTYTIYFELPELNAGAAEADGARVVFDGEATAPIELPLVEDLRSVARANHERQLPLIYARAFLRSSLKAAAVAVGTEAARRGRGGKGDTQAVIEIAGILGGLLFVSQTEKADLRCWTFLPGQAHAGIARLPPGEHRCHVDYLAQGRVLYSTPTRTITAGEGAGDLATVVEHFWR